jgi:hypothetical protein|eukprot:Transcript_22535.p2 GENE.Transcript_22535~~Transcript_22535.p2  ORF type:complete len:360 (-),score=15.69 Transcript_22535:14-1093(-)
MLRRAALLRACSAEAVMLRLTPRARLLRSGASGAPWAAVSHRGQQCSCPECSSAVLLRGAALQRRAKASKADARAARARDAKARLKDARAEAARVEAARVLAEEAEAEAPPGEPEWVGQTTYTRRRPSPSVFDETDVTALLTREMRSFMDRVSAAPPDPWFHRQSEKLVLAVLMVTVDGKPHFVSGMNAEVSLPAGGSFCAERSAIVAARAQFPGISRADFAGIAVLQVPLCSTGDPRPRPGPGPSFDCSLGPVLGPGPGPHPDPRPHPNSCCRCRSPRAARRPTLCARAAPAPSGSPSWARRRASASSRTSTSTWTRSRSSCRWLARSPLLELRPSSARPPGLLIHAAFSCASERRAL